MGNEIKIKDLTGYLRTAAEQANVGKDKKLTTEAEISAFMKTADSLVAAGLVNENYKETLGLTITQTSTEATFEEESLEVETKERKSLKERRAERKDKKRENEALEADKKRKEDLVFRQLDNLLNDDATTTANLIENLEKRLGEQAQDKDYVELTKTLNSVLRLTRRAKTIEELDDMDDSSLSAINVFKIDEKLAKKFIGICKLFVAKEIASRNVQYVHDKYQEKVGENENATQETLMNEVMKDIKDIKEDDKKLYKEMKKASKNYSDNKIMSKARELVYDAIDQVKDETNWKQVRKKAIQILKDNGTWDTYTEEAIEKYENWWHAIIGKKDGGRILSERQAIDNNVEDKSLQTKEEILGGLKKRSKEVFEALVNSGLITETTNEDGKKEYDLTQLQEIITICLGANKTRDRHNNKIDKAISEKFNTASTLAIETVLENLTEKESKQLYKLCGFKDEPLDWRGPVAGALFGGAISAGSAVSARSTIDDVVHIAGGKKSFYVDFNLNGIDESAISESNINALKEQGFDVSLLSTGLNLTISISKIKEDPEIIKTLAKNLPELAWKSAAIGAALGALKGLKPEGEKAEIPTNFDEIDYTKYIAKLKNHLDRIGGSELFAGLALLAGSFINKNGQWDHVAYKDLLNEAAGEGSKLNREELIAAIEDRKKALKAQQSTCDNQTECDIIVTDESTPAGEPIEEHLEFPYFVKNGDSWEAYVNAFYPGLVEKCGGLWGPKGAIRALKKALSYDKDGNFDKDKYQEILTSQGLPRNKDKNKPDILFPSEIMGIKVNRDGVVQPTNIEKGGTSTLGNVGREEIKVTPIPGTNLWKAIDGCDDNIDPAYGSTKEEAIANLKRQTGKEYANVIEK